MTKNVENNKPELEVLDTVETELVSGGVAHGEIELKYLNLRSESTKSSY